MQLRTGIVVTIIAVAVGVAAGRATAPRGRDQNPPVVAVAASPGAKTGWSDSTNPRSSFSDSPYTNYTKNIRGSTAFGEHSGSGGESRSPVAVVYVAGAVAKPGVYALRATARANDAVRAAGGATAQADLVAINLAARVEDGQEIAVPVRGAEAIASSGARHSASAHARPHSAKRGHHRKRRKRNDEATDDANAPAEMVDVNDADEATLETLPGIGSSLAERIIAFRDLNGPFASTDELLDVGGMTSAKVDLISPYVTFH